MVFETEELTEDLTLSGRINADLFVSITGTDADFIVKLIDVLPDTTVTPKGSPRGVQGRFMPQPQTHAFRVDEPLLGRLHRCLRSPLLPRHLDRLENHLTWTNTRATSTMFS